MSLEGSHQELESPAMSLSRAASPPVVIVTLPSNPIRSCQVFPYSH